MFESQEAQWLELARDVNATLSQIEGRHRLFLSGSHAWLERLRHNPTFSQLSADKLAAVILKLEEFPVTTGDVVIRQKDPGDYFYIVKSGSFTVSRRTPTGEIELLTQLTEGDTFGEAALLSGDARNASIVADRDGLLLRLSRDSFNALAQAELVKHVSLVEADRLAKAGARFLDVRRDTLGKSDTIGGAVVIPIDQLHARMAELNPQTAYIAYCLNGNLSEAAAFVLGQRGYDVAVLKGGLTGMAR